MISQNPLNRVKYIVMYAGDTKVFKAIKTLEDASALKADLTNLSGWTMGSGIGFNEIKCRAQSITRKSKPIFTTYKINDVPLESTCCERDLGVCVCSDLMWFWRKLRVQTSCLDMSEGTRIA